MENVSSKDFSLKSTFTDINDCSNLWNDDEIVKMDLYTACAVGLYNCVRQLLADGMEIVDLDQPNCDGWTPLMYAAYVGHDNIVNLLLDFPVDVNGRTRNRKKNYGATPLMLASSCGNDTVVYFLLQNGAKIDAQDNRGWTSLYYATYQGHANVAKMLLDNDADSEIRDHDMGMTPLLIAAREGHEVIFEMLLRHGASLQTRTRLGEDARTLAHQHRKNTVINIIDHQLFQHQPNYLLRSEPGLLLGNEDSDVIDSENRVSRGLQERSIVPMSRIKDGPEAFAKLIDGKKNGGEPINIPTPLGKQLQNVRVRGSPLNLAVSPEATVGSFEDHFFINCGRTVESASLHRRLQKVNSTEKCDIKISPQHHDIGVPTARPTLSKFLEELKLTKYLSVFEENNVDFNTLLTFTENDLKEVGIGVFGPRRKIFIALSHWKKEKNKPSTEQAVSKLTSEAKQLQHCLNVEEDLQHVVESRLMVGKEKQKEIDHSVYKSQEHFKQLEKEKEVLKVVNEELDKNTNLSKDQARELQDKLQCCTPNLESLACQGRTEIL